DHRAQPLRERRKNAACPARPHLADEAACAGGAARRFQKEEREARAGGVATSRERGARKRQRVRRVVAHRRGLLARPDHRVSHERGRKISADGMKSVATKTENTLVDLARTFASEETKLREGGGPDGLARQHKLGRLTARE